MVSRISCIYAAESVFGVRFDYRQGQRVAGRVRAARARGAARAVLGVRRRAVSANDPSDAGMRSLIELFRGLRLA